jgi:hypothetical protein
MCASKIIALLINIGMVTRGIKMSGLEGKLNPQKQADLGGKKIEVQMSSDLDRNLRAAWGFYTYEILSPPPQIPKHTTQHNVSVKTWSAP